jgi:hypothetical protein
LQGESGGTRERGAAYMAEQILREIIGKPLRIRCMSDAFGVLCVAGKVSQLVRCRGGQCSIINIEILSR